MAAGAGGPVERLREIQDALDKLSDPRHRSENSRGARCSRRGALTARAADLPAFVDRLRVVTNEVLQKAEPGVRCRAPPRPEPSRSRPGGIRAQSHAAISDKGASCGDRVREAPAKVWRAGRVLTCGSPHSTPDDMRALSLLCRVRHAPGSEGGAGPGADARRAAVRGCSGAPVSAHGARHRSGASRRLRLCDRRRQVRGCSHHRTWIALIAPVLLPRHRRVQGDVWGGLGLRS
jgi:hypothetical protein